MKGFRPGWSHMRHGLLRGPEKVVYWVVFSVAVVLTLVLITGAVLAVFGIGVPDGPSCQAFAP